MNGGEGRFVVKRLSDGKETAVSLYADSVEIFSDEHFTFVRVALQNDMPGVDLLRELTNGERAAISFVDQLGRTRFSYGAAMVVAVTVPYWVDGDMDMIKNTLELAEDYTGTFGLSFIVA